MSQDMRDFKQRCHNQKQKEEKHNAKKRREDFRNYDSYPSSKYGDN